MMKKILFTFISICLISVSLNAQTTPSTVIPTPDVDRKEAEFDKKFRFGIQYVFSWC